MMSSVTCPTGLHFSRVSRDQSHQVMYRFYVILLFIQYMHTVAVSDRVTVCLSSFIKFQDIAVIVIIIVAAAAAALSGDAFFVQLF